MDFLFILIALTLPIPCIGGSCVCQRKYADKITVYGPSCVIHSVHQQVSMRSFVPHDPWDPTEDFGENDWYRVGKTGVWSLDGKWRCTNVTVIGVPKFVYTKDDYVSVTRTACFGSCPTYTVTVYGNGTVSYFGSTNVQTKGYKVLHIDADKVTELFEAFDNADFVEIKDHKERVMTDQPSVFISNRFTGHKHSVNHYMGDPSAPKVLLTLENLVDATVNITSLTGNKGPISTYNISTASVALSRVEDYWGMWPSYSVNITGDGKVTWKGSWAGKYAQEKIVKEATDTISVEQVKGVIMELIAAGIQTAENYPNVIGKSITDQATAVVSLNLENKEYSFTHYFGNKEAPNSYWFMERTVDSAVNSCQWVKNQNIRCY